MSKVKQARDWFNANYCQSECAHYKTILTALSAMERSVAMDDKANATNDLPEVIKVRGFKDQHGIMLYAETFDYGQGTAYIQKEVAGKALNALERMQGVDLESFERVRKYIMEAHDESFLESDSIGWHSDKPIDVTFKDLVNFNNAAQTLTDIIKLTNEGK